MKRRRWAAAVALGVALLTGCGGAAVTHAEDHTYAEAGQGTVDLTAKPQVGGAVTWKENRLTIERSGQSLRILGNGLPNHQTGVYPFDSTISPDALRYDRNPNRIQQVQVS